jgi:arginyl-tRNA synthetase
LGNGRGGPIGDVLSNILKKSGFQVEREFYINDFGNQVNILGHSILDDKEAQYKGDYIDNLRQEADISIKDSMKIGNWAANIILERFIKPTVANAGINFNNWFSEKKLHDEHKVEKVIEELKEKGLTYEKDGALWYKSTTFGDDKDRVLKKSDGNFTYLAVDFAYHKDKLERGFDKLINIMGADHFKEAEVVKNFVEEYLEAKEKVEYILSQIVRVIRNGREIKMSKRKGVYFALDDLIAEVGKDPVRFIFTSYAPSSHINFDIDLAKERSEKNPVYYVQYAHARICSILEKAKNFSKEANLELLRHKKEWSLIRELNKFPELVREIAENYEVHKLPYYAISVADKFHSFYNTCRVIDEENIELTRARLNLARATKIVLEGTLKLIGVSAPKHM